MLRIKDNKGFGIMEVIVSIFVFAVGMLGILALANLTIRSSENSRMELVAAYLAQEGVEIVRDIRGLNTNWDDWYSAVSSGNYRVQYQDGDSTLLAYASTPLKLDAATGLYQYDTGTDTTFYRRVNLTKISSTQVRVTVEVSWLSRGRTFSLTVEDRLWNWR